MVGGFAVGEQDSDRLLGKYDSYVRVSARPLIPLSLSLSRSTLLVACLVQVYQQASNLKRLPFFNSRAADTWPEFVHSMFHNYPKRNIVVSLGTVRATSTFAFCLTLEVFARLAHSI